MSGFGKPQLCRNGCNKQIYFDRNSLVGHPTEHLWIPLEYRDGLKTDQAHQCPRRNQGPVISNGNGGNGNPTPVKQTDSKLDLDHLNMLKEIAAALQKYITIKEAGQ